MSGRWAYHLEAACQGDVDLFAQAAGLRPIRTVVCPRCTVLGAFLSHESEGYLKSIALSLPHGRGNLIAATLRAL